MTTSNDRLEALIRAALEGHDREMLKGTEEMSYFELGLSQFGGKLGWVTWVIMIVQSVMFLAGAWCAFRFFGTSEVIGALRWGLSSVALMVMATQLKLSLAPQMQADRVIREVKRLQLLVAVENSRATPGGEERD